MHQRTEMYESWIYHSRIKHINFKTPKFPMTAFSTQFDVIFHQKNRTHFSRPVPIRFLLRSVVTIREVSFCRAELIW